MQTDMAGTDVIESVRAVVLVVEGHGMIKEAHGGFGGFLGIDVPALVGTTVFDHIRPEDADELAMYFIENVTESGDTVALPLPFRLSIIDDGIDHPVDIIPTGRIEADGHWRWTVMIVPLSLNGSIIRSLDLEMSGASRDDVRRMLCEELLVDNDNYTSRWVLVGLEDPQHPTFTTSRADDADIVAAVRSDIVERRWAPWTGMVANQTTAINVTMLAADTRRLMDARGWRRTIVAPVYVRDRLIAAFIQLGRVPDEYPADYVKINVAARIQTLVNAAALLFERWEDRDQLEHAAATDVLTGLTNRRALLIELADERRTGSLLYVDVDEFKAVNDGYGHEIGDRVLIAIAERLTATCRADDTVGRVGGDEFVVLLHGADDDVATDIAHRVREAVSAPLGIPGGPDSVSVSVGQSSLDDHNPLDVADRAMLQAKRSRVPAG